jgi:hypothetical protein
MVLMLRNATRLAALLSSMDWTRMGVCLRQTADESQRAVGEGQIGVKLDVQRTGLGRTKTARRPGWGEAYWALRKNAHRGSGRLNGARC